MFQHARPVEGRRIYFFLRTKGEPASDKEIKRIPHFDPRMIHDHDPQLIFAQAHCPRVCFDSLIENLTLSCFSFAAPIQ